MGPGHTQDLLVEALAGSAQALNQLLEHIRPRLVLWSAARMGGKLKGRYEPEDVAQLILISVVEGWKGFDARNPGGFWAWVRRIADHDLKDLVDYEGALKRRLPTPASFTQVSPSTAASRREEVSQMMAALVALDEVHREVIVLRDIEQRSVAEVAEVLGRTPNAVRILHCRALKALRESLGLVTSRARGETIP